MNFDNYKIKFDGVDGVMFSGLRPRKCIISFSSMNTGKFERWSWFYDLHTSGSEDVYIILKDDTHRYYIGDDDHATYLKHHRFFESILEQHGIDKDNVFLVGGSMGGYAALYFGLWLGAKAVVAVNPQTTYAASRCHNLPLWERKIRETGNNWVDLDLFARRFDHTPIVLIEHGEHSADVAAAHALALVLTERKATHFRSYVNGGHGGASLTKEKMLSFFALASNF
jgi:pimeloyl-ACP methyl ester carboxylesterase